MLQMLETSAIILAYTPSGIPNPCMPQRSGKGTRCTPHHRPAETNLASTSVLARFVKGYTQASLEKDEARGVMENVLFSMH